MYAALSYSFGFVAFIRSSCLVDVMWLWTIGTLMSNRNSAIERYAFDYYYSRISLVITICDNSDILKPMDSRISLISHTLNMLHRYHTNPRMLHVITGRLRDLFCPVFDRMPTNCFSFP